ncbi:hypothetical protein MMC14_009558 [Varicellaria rhodocarpa]|nr:hypothetical protein [Varicellaria rhodocarpa]
MPEASNDEQSPLLGGDNSKSVDNGTIERGSEQSDSPDNDGETPISEEPSTKKLIAVMSSIWFGSFLAALDTTIIATLSGPISNSFNSLSLFSWLASAYFIANAALQPLSGKLTDIFSRRAGLVFSNIFFGVGNLICGLATKEWVMILGRVIAGMGGGGLFAISTFIGSDLIPLRRRGLWQGFGNICFGLGTGFGGVFGGWINDTIGWRWAFLIQVPLVAISGLVVWFTVKIPVKKTEEAAWKRIDYLGSITLVASLVILLLGLNSGGNLVPWTHPLVLSTLPLSVVIFVLFIYIENRAAEPIIPVKLLLNRTVASACLTNWFMTMCVFGIIYYVPIYLQVRGMSPTQTGVRLILYSIGVAVGSVGTGILMRWSGRYYVLSVFLEATFVLSLALMSTFNSTTPNWPPYLYLFLHGIAYAGMLTVTLLALLSAVDHQYQAVITSASYAFRSTGSTIGITIASSVFQNLLKGQLWKRFGDRENAGEIIQRVRDSLDEIKYLHPGWRDGVVEAYNDALRGVFLTLLGIGILGAMVSLFMRENTLHSNLARKPTRT